MKHLINIINQIFELEKKSAGQNIQRHVNRIKTELEEMGYSFHNPEGERWDETRTDCEASITGTLLKRKMVITSVVKPVVFQTVDGVKKIIQKAIVVVE